MVGVLSEIAKRLGVPPFYVAFVLAPAAVSAPRRARRSAASRAAARRVSPTSTLHAHTHVARPPLRRRAPRQSNGAEVLSAYAFAKRKSVRASTTSFSTLLGAAVMNNTFCLAVFMGLIVARGDLCGAARPPPLVPGAKIEPLLPAAASRLPFARLRQLLGIHG